MTSPVRIEKVTNGYIIQVQDSFSQGNRNEAIFVDFADLIDWLMAHFKEDIHIPTSP